MTLHTARRHPLTTMFAPRSIAIVGASDRSGWSRYTVDNLRRTGYTGDLHLVNRRGGEVHGQQAVPSLTDVPDGVDLAYVLTGPDSLPSVLDEAHDRKIPNLAVIAAGFGETGDEGAAYERRLVEQATEQGITMLGPNNLGFLNLVNNVNPWSQMMPSAPQRGGVGVMSQSGALGIFLLNHLEQRDVGLSHLVTVGNEAMVTVAEGIDYLVDEPDTRVIALYLESIRRPEAFLAAVDRALSAGKPVVAYKAGRGETGARVAAAHTGALAGDDAVFEAVFHQHGVIRVDTIEDLVTTAGLLDAYGELLGERVGFVTASGAMCGVISDAADTVGLQLPDFAPETKQALRDGGLPPFATPQNPLDTTGYVVVNPSILPMSARVVAADPNIDVLVVHNSIPPSQEAAVFMQDSVHDLQELVRTSRVPVIPMEFLPSDRSAFARDYRRAHGLPHVVDSFSRGVPALGRAIWWSQRHRERLTRSEAPALPAPLLRDRPRTGIWSEQEAVALLRDYGIPVVPSAEVKSAEDAVDAAEAAGYPAVLKVVSADLPHKSDVGGVALNLGDAEAVRAAYNRMLATVGERAPGAAIEGVAVSPMRTGGIEVLVGVVRDPVWGLTMAIALGGVWVEVMGDAALRRLPVTDADVRQALSELKAYPLLTGARGGKPVDLDALAGTAARIGALAIALGDDLTELEVNPLHVREGRIEALDALIRWTN